MRVLVTGGAGYLGGFTAERLVELGYEVTVLDNLWRGHADAVPKGAKLVQADLRSLDAVMQAVSEAKPDAVMHFAAATLVSESMGHVRSYFGINVAGSLHLLNAMIENGCKKLVFSSSAAVYGIPDSSPVGEDAPKAPINPYGLSKLMVEQTLEWHERAYGLNWAAMRYFNIAGGTATRGERHDPETHLIPVLLETAIGKREKFTIFGDDYPTPDGTAIRDYVEVRDLADAHILALEQLDRPLGAFNFGTRGGFSVREVLDAVRRVTGRAFPVEVGPRRAGDPPELVADSTRARTELGWNPTRSDLDTMVAGAWEWLQSELTGPQ